MSRVARVNIVAPARLHLGFLDLHGGLGRRFGGIGVGVREVALIMSLRRRAASGVRVFGSHRKTDRVVYDYEADDSGGARAIGGGDDGGSGAVVNEAFAAATTRIAETAAALLRHFDLDGGVEIDLERLILPHEGLGSGTQTALALGAAFSRLFGLKATVEEIAIAAGRGQRSGIGIGVFKHGGFILDGGRGGRQPLPAIVSRLAFPPQWRFALVFDRSRQGVSGARERDAFAALPPVDAALAAEACRLVLMQTLPAVIERDCPRFGESISRIQRICGSHFAPAQGGLFSSPAVEEAVQALIAAGATGGGQTSWGPTGFAVFPDTASARQAIKAFSRQHADRDDIALLLTAAENRKARLRTLSGDAVAAGE